jgi:hypothetical protein
MERRVYSASELEEALRSGSLKQPSYEIEVMINSEKPGVLVSLGDCETWIGLPLELVKSAERTGDRPCRNAIHPVFLITFKEPSDPASQQLLEDFLTKLAS